MPEQADTITISMTEYESLKKDSALLGCLEEAGVDNWSGYGEAWSLLKERE